MRENTNNHLPNKVFINHVSLAAIQYPRSTQAIITDINPETNNLVKPIVHLARGFQGLDPHSLIRVTCIFTNAKKKY